MTILPFICLGIGIILGLFIKEKKIIGYSEKISSVALALLMITIGLNIGIDKAIMKNFFKIGFNCIGISLLAIIFSVIFTFICEKTILPLKQIKEELERKDIDILSEKTVENSESSESNSWFVWMMPISVIIGLLLGILLEEKISPLIIDNSFTYF